MIKPDGRYEPTKARENDIESHLPTYTKHLLCDEKGNYPAELNSWEQKVVDKEAKREGFSFWYRNPQQPSPASLGIAYTIGDQYGILRPDFIFFSTLQDDSVAADIVDPHGLHLADALPKLRGLVEYALAHSESFRRIESVAEAAGKLRVLDLKNKSVQGAVMNATDAMSLFTGTLAKDY